MHNTKRLTVRASSTYDVVIAKGIINSVGKELQPIISAKKIALITDDVVNALYGDVVEKSLENAGYNVAKYVFPNGEKSKNIATYADILSFLAIEQLTRTDAIVALGGGVVGDMAGFAAATYLRGIKYVQIPTTLLAQIDSSVGGKTAIDLKEGKNLVGAFCQPQIVLCDVDTLQTLPKDIYLDGMGEAVKYAILDKAVCELLEAPDYDVQELVYLCVDYKRRVVEKDEYESGLRRLLNLGHTIAHAIESISNYTISHGKAVAMGLKTIINASKKRALIDDATCKRALAVVNIAEGGDCPYDVKDVVAASLVDKKRAANNIHLIMVYGIGDAREVTVDVERLEEYLG